VLNRHGLLWPFNTHLHDPIAANVAGGSIITGFGGDELFRTADTARVDRLLAGRVRPVPRDLTRLAFALSPVAVRRRVYRRRGTLVLPWLRPAAQALLNDTVARVDARDRPGWARRIRRWWWRSRWLNVCRASFDALGEAHDVRFHHPFTDGAVLDAMAGLGGVAGLPGRTPAMRALFGDILPERLITRVSKAGFTHPLYLEHARGFAAGWSGDGVDLDLVDPEALRATWLSDYPNVLATALLQQAWLASAPAAVSGGDEGGQRAPTSD
jgi:asparagine synthase (glutamine-hydrolysing)